MLEILLQTADFVAVNKPAGIAVHQEEGEDNLLQQLAKQLGVPRLWLLHRLDKPTSGVLLFALNPQAASCLAQQFAAHAMQKTYLALSDGKPLKKQGWVKGGMEKSRRGTWKLTRSQQNFAVTQFHSSSLRPNLRLFVLQPHTGKTHQLRVAMKSLSAPILGDTAYGGTTACRLFLHAWRIRFHYLDTVFDITAPLGSEWPSDIPALLPDNSA
ncbi:TIGR01621 family pseudouridine synthase [Neisseria animalis]|uniref:TIGR01621 family pseudouridine synthase n=1 Tax=Neisseria animalis TaxID=492 RepID=A0A5P3MT51_NEIAN|nr:TIGR01621 family pseudouridine synthase [Neisseria animalis]QEY23961.1 TIGR01621 family pseudouridine synthase [Neisseria animalis]ROW31641.1 TIGR01621 family pseudouridine synthase [Neisseria animalis]VEE05961.1 putative psedouridine synthase [Neisseria animalis]